MTGPVLTLDMTRVLLFSARSTQRAQEYAKPGACRERGVQILEQSCINSKHGMHSGSGNRLPMQRHGLNQLEMRAEEFVMP